MNQFLKHRRIAWGRIIGCCLVLLLLAAGAFGLHLLNIYSGDAAAEPDPEKYTVMGVDVSRYQGNIDWETLEAQNVTFAFIKATEGSSHQDPCFAENWQNVQATGIYTGAYHFFSFESSGETQAQNFIRTVGELDGHLPPVVDFEFYGDYADSPLSRQETREILDVLLEQLEAHYHVKPIIYLTARTYYHYILGGDYSAYPLWIRDTYTEPLPKWAFWQYSDTGKLAGYDGIQADHTEMCIDLNVYHDSLEQFLETFSLSDSTTGQAVQPEQEMLCERE